MSYTIRVATYGVHRCIKYIVIGHQLLVTDELCTKIIFSMLNIRSFCHNGMNLPI